MKYCIYVPPMYLLAPARNAPPSLPRLHLIVSWCTRLYLRPQASSCFLWIAFHTLVPHALASVSLAVSSSLSATSQSFSITVIPLLHVCRYRAFKWCIAKMPGLFRKLVVRPATDGLVLQPIHQRVQAQRGLKIAYGSHMILATTDPVDRDDSSLVCHGIVGICFPFAHQRNVTKSI